MSRNTTLIPGVTVFIPTYNRLPLLQKAVTSALSQGESVLVHVLDNASTDGTRDWLLRAAESHPHLQATFRENNVGAHMNFVEGFDSVTTDYLIPLADDDELLPGYIKSALHVAETDPALGAVIFKCDVRRDGLSLYYSPDNAPEGFLGPQDHLRFWLQNGHYVSWSSVLWSTQAVRHCGVAADLERFGLPSDVWFQCRVFSEFPVHFVNQSGATFNCHPDQTSRSLRCDSACLSQMSYLHRHINSLLVDQKLFSDVERRRLMRTFTTRSCFFMKDWLSRTTFDEQFRLDFPRMVAAYREGFRPFCGWRPFPLLPHRATNLSDFCERARMWIRCLIGPRPNDEA